MTTYQNNLSIKSWAEEDRPREKLLLKGKSALSEAELIGILIGSGTKELSAVELSKQILAHIDNDLNELAKLSVKDLEKFKGIGQAKAICIVSALELGRRRKATSSNEKPRIIEPCDAYELMKPDLLDLDFEEFWVILLNRANNVLKKIKVSSGGVAGTVVDSKIILKHAIENLASGIILVHNHPSGNTKPSQADIKLTKGLQEASRFMGIDLYDHVIFADKGYYSFSEDGLI
ncbi:MAG: DNA repair protein RadC [Cyclobacteriaceae bacterium]